MKKYFAISIIFLFSAFVSLSQNASGIILRGKVSNFSTGEPISYATLRLSRNGVNTMSNEEGAFILKIPAEQISDSIYVTHVGFESVVINAGLHSGLLEIRLREKINQLQLVVVTPVNALEIVKKAVAKIPDNYPSSPYLLNGFYRMTGTKESDIVHLSEAVFDIYNESHKKKNKQVKLIKSRLNKDLTAFNGNNDFNFGATPEDILDYDIVSNANETDLLSKRGLSNYRFIYKGLTNYNGTEAHEIMFDQRDGIKKSLKQGTMMIDADDLAFLEFRYRLSPKGIKYWSLGFGKKMMLKLLNIRIDLLQDSTLVTYRRYGGRYYINHVKGNSQWHIVGGRDRFELNPFRLKNNYLITRIDTAEAKPFPKEDLLGNNEFIEKPLNIDSADISDTFWHQYNLIQPEFDVDSVARGIHRNNQTLNYKKELEAGLSTIKGNQDLRIDSIFKFYNRLGQFNGMALVEHNGKIIYEKGFGLANREKQIPNDQETQFRIGSASKQFTAMLIMQLMHDKKLKIDDPVETFLPEYIHKNITIQQLLTHQSGVPNYTNHPDHLSKIVLKKYSLEELVRQFCSDSLEFEPGTQFHYSNAGYVILALVIQKITGKSYARILEEKIFAPLGMKHSYFGSDLPVGNKMAIGYVNDQREMIYPVENVIGAGGITSTVDDLLIWSRALSTDSLLPHSDMKQIFEPRVEWKEWGAHYGYGWMLDRYVFKVSGKHTIQYHPGTEPGFYAMLVRQPDKNITIIMLNNTGEFPRFDMTDLLLTELN